MLDEQEKRIVDGHDLVHNGAILDRYAMSNFKGGELVEVQDRVSSIPLHSVVHLAALRQTSLGSVGAPRNPTSRCLRATPRPTSSRASSPTSGSSTSRAARPRAPRAEDRAGRGTC